MADLRLDATFAPLANTADAATDLAQAGVPRMSCGFWTDKGFPGEIAKFIDMCQ